MDGSDMKPNEQFLQTTPGLRLSSLFINPNSLSFLPFANQSNNLLTPNYGRFSGGLHSSRAGDLHTPTMGLGRRICSPSLSSWMLGPRNRTLGLWVSINLASSRHSHRVHSSTMARAMTPWMNSSKIHRCMIQTYKLISP